MRANTARRAALLDAAIDLLAREGARGLTFRAVDAAAGVPTGTASNYFTDRDDLLVQVGRRVYERMEPGAAQAARTIGGPPGRDRVVALLHDLVDRMTRFEPGWLALVELRLEATRRPALRALLTERVRADLEGDIAYHRGAGLPGDDTTVVLLYLALSWLVLDRLTVPELFDAGRAHALVEELVARLVPPAPDRPQQAR